MLRDPIIARMKELALRNKDRVAMHGMPQGKKTPATHPWLADFSLLDSVSDEDLLQKFEWFVYRCYQQR